MRMGQKRCDTIGDASGLGVTFIIICLRCFRVRRIRASALCGPIGTTPRIHRETPIAEIGPRLRCTGTADLPGCGHRGAYTHMTLDGFPELSDHEYLGLTFSKLTERRPRRRWR